MDSSLNAKQQIVERVKQSTNILVTVSNSPSVDALSAALAFTLVLNKLDKHATAVFSGAIPPAIKFLDPLKTFESKVDSLRDFIIALDKEKADRLRYKVEDEVVKIFITPYRASISEKDLHFSQGDFNVDLIIALGVERREDLDRAITAHGRILHDAAVMTINAANQKSSLGSVDWQDATASSLCEMLLALCEALQPGMLDQQLSTALLTGIVAATERFSNQRTTPRVMTMAAQLMAAGANQQLIATNLQTLTAIAPPALNPANGSTKIVAAAAKSSKSDNNGEMHITHDEDEVSSPEATVPPASTPPAPNLEPEFPIAPPAAAAFTELKQALETETTQQKTASKPAPKQSNNNRQNNTQSSRQSQTQKKKDEAGYVTDKPSWMGRNIQPPTMGGSLSATTEEAFEDKLREEADERNRTLLTHGEVVPDEPSVPPVEAPSNVEPTPQPEELVMNPEPEPEPVAEEPVTPPTPLTPEPEAPIVPPAPVPEPEAAPAPVEAPASLPAVPVQPPEPAIEEPQGSEPSIEALEKEAKAESNRVEDSTGELDAARRAVTDALETEPRPADEAIESIGAQEFTPVADVPAPQQAAVEPSPLPTPPMPSFSPMPAAPAPIPTPPPLQEAMPQQNTVPNALPLPPLPDFSTLPPPPAMQTPQLPPLPETPAPVEPPAPAPNDPHQFKIPGA